MFQIRVRVYLQASGLMATIVLSIQTRMESGCWDEGLYIDSLHTQLLSRHRVRKF